ncbi:MAG: hypothetical protein JSC188_000290 [Candidatus Tokpelaia sp. JSC188]|nr:MAG: hypothetical protein JSC188_000290 [Candidatus Tokpelaia sp. JSC188]
MELKLAKFTNRFFRTLFLTAVSFSVSSCFPVPSGQLSSLHLDKIDGQWVDDNGIVSSFYNGIFETRSPDTNEKLAEGNYISRSNGLIELEIRSFIRGTVSHVNCSLANSSHLLCTSRDSFNFSLTKHI